METRLLARVTRQISKVRGGGRLTSLIVKRHRRISRPFVQHRVRGFVMHLDPHDFIDSEILFYSDQYERAELNFLSEHLKPGDTFADLGAHIGMHTLVASRAVGGAGLVISVEADPQTFRRLEGHLASNGVTNVRPFNYGVSDCEGLFTFYRCAQSIKNTGANSFLPRAERNWYPGFEMRCMTLRNLLKAGGAPRLDAVKLDLEGFEYRVLKRFFEEAELNFWPNLLMFEQYPGWGDAKEECTNLLSSLGVYREVNVKDMSQPNHVFIRV